MVCYKPADIAYLTNAHEKRRPRNTSTYRSKWRYMFCGRSGLVGGLLRGRICRRPRTGKRYETCTFTRAGGFWVSAPSLTLSVACVAACLQHDLLLLVKFSALRIKGTRWQVPLFRCPSSTRRSLTLQIRPPRCCAERKPHNPALAGICRPVSCRRAHPRAGTPDVGQRQALAVSRTWCGHS